MSLQIDRVEQVALNVVLVDSDAFNLANSFWLTALGQHLQGANAVPANGREKVDSLQRACLEPGRDAPANDVAVRQQSLEVVCNAGPSEWLVANVKRQRQRDWATQFCVLPALIVLELGFPVAIDCPSSNVIAVCPQVERLAV